MKLSPKTRNLYVLIACAMLIAISVVFQVVHIGIQTQWGMWIDIVAIPCLIAYFLYGFGPAFLVSAISCGIIALVAPSGMLGAFMKIISTFPMYAIPALLVSRLKDKLGAFEKAKWLIPGLLLAIVVRGAIVLPANYYFAIPIWTGMTAQQAIKFVPPWIMFGLNAIQGIVDLIIAWFIVYKFKLKRFRWES